ncbi:MAG: hypothetical protein D6689_12550 [Deltaproteobacteria bacterium]|nr:MAG: hypothetical protein D6689_12550 [Deltaproteobacteria bacterium]
MKETGRGERVERRDRGRGRWERFGRAAPWRPGPGLAGARTAARARQLEWVSRAAAATFGAYAVWFAAAYAWWFGAALVGGAAAVALCVPRCLQKAGSVALAGNVLAAACFAGIGALAAARGGFPTSVLVWNATIPMCAVLVASRRWVVGMWTLLCIGEVAAWFALDRAGVAPAGVVAWSPAQQAVAQFTSVVGLTLFLLAAARFPARTNVQLAGTCDRLAVELEHARRLDALATLAGGIAHDFGNVVSGIAASARLLEVKTPADDPRRTEIATIRDAAERAAALTRQLMTFAQRDDAQPRRVDINAAISAIEPLVRRVVGAHVAVVVDLDPAAGCTCIDPRQLDRVVLNLAVNARDTMPDGGTLVVRTRSVYESTDRRARRLAPRFAAIEVSDTGCGMSRDVREHIFEPFFTTKSAAGGTGLGLATCYGIVAQAGGAIDVESEPGRGSVFRVLLPVAQRAAADDDAGARTPPVVVVDDVGVRRALTEGDGTVKN